MISLFTTYLLWQLMTVVHVPAKPVVTPAKEEIKNVILLIGDGMGVSQLSATFYYSPQDKIPNLARFPYVGLMTTSSCEEKITDSAAGATAFATGKKTSNGRIGMSADKEILMNLPEWLLKLGISSGLVSTSSITHATPAAFFAHEASRHKEYEIAEEMINSPIRYFAGGGIKYFSTGANDDLIGKMQREGWVIDTSGLKIPEGSPEQTRYGFLLANNSMPRIVEGRGSFLRDASINAIEFLNKDPQGFFLMAEAAQIDWGGHANNGKYIIEEMLDFDEAIGAILDFAEKDGHTLVIVTADHETGGFTLSAEEKKVPFQGIQRDYNAIAPTFSTGGHSAALVPVLAYGPGAENFTGIYPNTEIFQKITALLKD